MNTNKQINIQLILKNHIRDTEGKKIASDTKRFLSIDTGKIKSSKVFTILYELPKNKIHEFAENCLKDSIINDIYINSLYNDSFYKSYILISKLQGITDDEGISTQKTMCDFFNISLDTKTQHIYTQKLYYIESKLNDSELKLIAEELLGNKMLNHFAYGSFEGTIDYIPKVKITENQSTEIINVFVSDDELLNISKSKLLSLNLEEMKAIQDYYNKNTVKKSRVGANISELPTDCEIEILAQTWSEHCKHKEFSAIIHFKDFENEEEKEIDSLFNTYIKASTEIIEKRLKQSGNNWLVKVFSDNAGVVRINNDYVFVWKVETHNSPSAIDPYGGAITGILGNNRDPLGTGIGGGKLLFNTNVLCFGSPFYDGKLLTNQLHPKRVFEGVRKGIEDGGNKSGVPTVNGSIIFDDRYRGKPLVYCGTGSIMPSSYKGRNSWEKIIESGDYIVMAGGRVGKDGIHGATFSSAEIDEKSPRSAVQIGSPIVQKLLSDFLEKASIIGLIKASTDNGAGGLSSSIGELAQISGGAIVNLEQVPLKYQGLKPWEIFVSESQERMTLVIEKKNLTELFNLAEIMEVELSTIGKFTSTGFLDVRYNDKKLAYLELEFLHNGVPKKRIEAIWQKPNLKEPSLPRIDDYNQILLKLIASLNICSRENVIRQYDHEVKGKTIIKPLMGINGKTPQDAAVMRFGFDDFVDSSCKYDDSSCKYDDSSCKYDDSFCKDNSSYEGIAVSNGIIPRYGDIDPYEMSAGSFDEAIRQIISVGGKLPDINNENNLFWSVNDNFCVPDSIYNEKSNPDGKIKFGKLVKMCQALYDMATYYNIPMTSGKDSMKNDFIADGEKISVPPTILYSMVAKIEDVRKTTTSDFKMAGDFIYIVGKTYNELGGSEFYKLFDELGVNVPRVRKTQAKRIYLKMGNLHDKGIIESSHDISDGGMIVAIAESTLGTAFGVDIDLSNIEGLHLNAILFSESHSRFVVSIKPENKSVFDAVMKDDALYIGRVTKETKIRVNYKNRTVINIATEILLKAWSETLEI